MTAFVGIAEALLRYQAAPAPTASTGSKANRTRQLLRTLGPLTAAEICREVDFPNTGLVYAALKHDLVAGRVVFDGARGGRYQWIGDGVDTSRGGEQ